jgi:hypothetical protein
MAVPMNFAFFGAYLKGYHAFEEQGAGARCPYPDYRGGAHLQVVTFSRAFQKYWYEGFEDAQAKKVPRYMKSGSRIVDSSPAYTAAGEIEKVEREVSEFITRTMQSMNNDVFGTSTSAAEPTTLTAESMQKAYDALEILSKLDSLERIAYAYADQDKIGPALEKNGFHRSPYMEEHFLANPTGPVYDVIGIQVTPSAACKRNHLILLFASGKIQEVEITDWGE